MMAVRQLLPNDFAASVSATVKTGSSAGRRACVLLRPVIRQCCCYSSDAFLEDAFFEDEGFRERFAECPASLTGRHATLGGLLKHTVEVTAIARNLGRVFQADQSLVVAGSLLHDVGKTEAFRWDETFAPSHAGQSVGPAVLGSALLQKRLGAAPVPVLSAEELEELQHIVVLASDDPPPDLVEPRNRQASVIRMANGLSMRGPVDELPNLDVHGLFGPGAGPGAGG